MGKQIAESTFAQLIQELTAKAVEGKSPEKILSPLLHERLQLAASRQDHELET
jgi:hypothetical protein